MQTDDQRAGGRPSSTQPSGIPEDQFEGLTALAADLCDTPLALVRLVDGDRLWSNSGLGDGVDFKAGESPLGLRRIPGTGLFVVDDARKDFRLARHPLVVGDPHLRFYAEAPLISQEGDPLGTLCVLDVVPRLLTARQRRHLLALAHQVVALLLLRRRTAELQAAKVQGVALERSRSMLQGVLSYTDALVYAKDLDGHFTLTNEALDRVLDAPAGTVVGRTDYDLMPAEVADEFRRHDREIAAGGQREVQTERMQHPDGTWHDYLSTKFPLLDTDGRICAVGGMMTDVTELADQRREMAESEANLTAVAKVIKQIQTGGDARQTIVDATLQLARATNVALIEAHPDGQALWPTTATDPDLVGMQIPLGAASAAVEAFTTGRPIFFSDSGLLPPVDPGTPARGGDGSTYFVPVRSADVVTAVLVVGWAQPVAGLDDRRVGVVTLLADQAGVAFRQSALLAELEALAVTDPLTLLPNRRGWDQRLTIVIAMARRSHLPVTIAIADLDHFKGFNDAHGHPAGDVLLRQFADAAKAAIRAGDTIARWGGEEFAIALPDCDAEAAAGVLERVRQALPAPNTCSIGYATWDGSERPEEVVERADRALYGAKRAGRDRISPAGLTDQERGQPGPQADHGGRKDI